MTACRAAPALLALALACAPRGDPAPGAGEPAGRGPAYAFFVAGHVYGDPRGAQLGLHPPFAARLAWLAARPGVAFGVFTGDIVRLPTPEHWAAVDAQLAAIGVPVRFAVGNHDLVPPEKVGEHPGLLDRAAYERRYGPTWYAFEHGGDRFVVLDPNRAGWSIAGEQLAFLERQLAERDRWRRLFVFLHQVVWADPERYPDLRTNSRYGRVDPVNFWSEVAPRLEALERDVWLFAGDLGADERASAFDYRRAGRLHLVASGMGDGRRDNCLLVEVGPADVRVRLVALGGDDPDALGPLEPR